MAEGLNEAQQRAVEHEGGPLIVLAGPGTGKTRVIISRVEHLIRVRGVDPANIVAVTFTVKAAGELRERLRGLIGGPADAVNAHTFHGFGRRLLARFGDMIGVAPRPRIMDSAQQKRLLRELIGEHGLFGDAAARGREFAVERAARDLGRLANHAVEPDDCERFARAWEERLTRNEAGLGEEELAAERGRQAHFADLVRLHRFFDEACRERGWVTMDEMITLPVRLLKQKAVAAAMCRSDYRHIVVDEFQDVNRAQIELLRLLSPPGPAGASGAGRDLCVVGDDDQSIYEFRGADDQAFKHFARIWERHTEITLTENYRSEKAVIDAANAVISRAKKRFAKGKVVELPRARREGHDDKPGAGVECVNLVDDKQDGDVIAAMILADRAGAGSPERAWRDYAVIARTNRDLDRISAALRIEGVPVRVSRRDSALEDEGVKDVLAWIEALVDPDAMWAVARILRRPPLHVPAERVIGWQSLYRAQRSRAAAGDEGTAAPGGYIQWLAERCPEEQGVVRMAGWYAMLRDLGAACAADEAVFRIITTTDAAHADLLPARRRAVRITNLVSLLRLARSVQSDLEQPGDLAAFWSYFQDLDESERELRSDGEDRIDGGPEPAEAAGASEADDDAVQLLTAHKAKGLEFDTVFVPRVSPSQGYGKVGAEEDDPLPDGLLEAGENGGTWRDGRLDEERRLLYVACTRAERRLVLLAKKNKRASKSTHFFEELALRPVGQRLVTVREADDVLRQASEAGVGLGGIGRGGGAGGYDALHTERLAYKDAEARREALERTRREARLLAAMALDAADRPDLSADDLAGVMERLMEAAARVAVTARVERCGEAPAWAAGLGGGAVGEFAKRLVTVAGAGCGDASKPDASGAARTGVLRPMEGPLTLSYTMVNDYIRCARCFYVKHVLKLDPRPGAAEVVGTAVHAALEAFYRRWRDADADGLAKPGLEEMARLGRAAFFAEWPKGQMVDGGQFDQVAAQLRLAYQRLHEPDLHVLEVEWQLTFPYECAGRRHEFKAKIDRLDQIALGSDGSAGTTGVRIVDYKTGRPRKDLLEPGPKDLQLGIYAMALRHSRSVGDGPTPRVGGLAEYWILSTGERGAIGLEKLDEDAVRGTIDQAVEGMLGGRYEKGEDCSGDCAILGLD